jgi:hypothetical protein
VVAVPEGCGTDCAYEVRDGANPTQATKLTTPTASFRLLRIQENPPASFGKHSTAQHSDIEERSWLYAAVVTR